MSMTLSSLDSISCNKLLLHVIDRCLLIDVRRLLEGKDRSWEIDGIFSSRFPKLIIAIQS